MIMDENGNFLRKVYRLENPDELMIDIAYRKSQGELQTYECSYIPCWHQVRMHELCKGDYFVLEEKRDLYQADSDGYHYNAVGQIDCHRTDLVVNMPRSFSNMVEQS